MKLLEGIFHDLCCKSNCLDHFSVKKRVGLLGNGVGIVGLEVDNKKRERLSEAKMLRSEKSLCFALDIA